MAVEAVEVEVDPSLRAVQVGGGGAGGMVGSGEHIFVLHSRWRMTRRSGF